MNPLTLLQNIPFTRRSSVFLSLIFSVLILVKNVWLYWAYGYAFYPDSNLYVHLGASLFETWYVSPLVTFPYPFLNAITNSSSNPALLIYAQIILSSVVAGFFVYVVSKSNWILASLIGLFLTFDLMWGAVTRAILTDGLFATFNLLGLGLILFHFQRRKNLPGWELVLAGILFGLIVSIRPSNIFLIILLPPLYAWFTRSWKKVLSLSLGIAIFFSLVGYINLKGTQKLFILSNDGSYTSDYLAFPLFIYNFFSPENGPASATIDQYLQTCYPGLVYSEAVDRSEGMAFDSVTNMNFIVQKVLPCVQSQKTLLNDERNHFPIAYLEALLKKPLQFAGAIVREVGFFLRYGNPYVLRWQLNAHLNYGCDGIAWCNQVTQARYEWNSNNLVIAFYEKAATKIFQVYLAPVGLISILSPEKQVFPVLFSWIVMFGFTVLFTKGWERLFVLSVNVLILYTAVVVVVGLGFTERYASMLSPLQAVYSAVAWFTALKLFAVLWRKALSYRFRSRQDDVKHSLR